MTEAEWLTSTDPQAMLEALHQASLDGWGRPSFRIVADRKLRLFACACCRAAGVEVRDSDEEKPPPGQADLSPRQWAMSWAFRHDGLPGYPTKVQRAAFIRDIFGNPFDQRFKVRWGQVHEHAQGAAPRVPSWFTWHDGIVVKLAQAAYDERAHPCLQCAFVEASGYAQRDFLSHQTGKCAVCHGTGTISDGTLDAGRLSILADALEEAGCMEDDILRHLRGQEWCWKCQGEGKAWQSCDVCNPYRFKWDFWSGWVPLRGPHVRGCWVLDLLLGEE